MAPVPKTPQGSFPLAPSCIAISWCFMLKNTLIPLALASPPTCSNSMPLDASQ
jgi:hypothetical protein